MRPMFERTQLVNSLISLNVQHTLNAEKLQALAHYFEQHCTTIAFTVTIMSVMFSQVYSWLQLSSHWIAPLLWSKLNKMKLIKV